MSSSTEELRIAMETTLTTFLENYHIAVRDKNASLLSAVLSPDCTRHLKPSSFVDAYPFIKGAETNAEYKARMTPEIALMEETRAKILESAVDPANRTASARAEHWTKIANREPTTLEICWFLDFTDDGTKISRVVEFIDTAVATRMIEDMLKQGYRKDENST
ncbi:hypothetical protein M426DRAFT_25056 [Hypoxylon sp. CI-4A]|nr:hypothetical protein M426DRAFT_25056 [Hypoxylon sp. CI-4A]